MQVQAGIVTKENYERECVFHIAHDIVRRQVFQKMTAADQKRLQNLMDMTALGGGDFNN